MPASGEQLSVPALLDAAQQRTGLGDFGDTEFLPALELLVDSCRATAALNETGRRVLPRVVLRHLVNRLYIQEHRRRHPEVVGAPLSVAMVVTGLPRTGTTLLHNLLALDPSARVLRLWEALHPVPPEAEGRRSEAALIAQGERWLEALYQLAPVFRTIHPGSAHGPEECDALLQNDFASMHFDDMFRAEDYSRWLDQADLRREYESYALQLRGLGASSGPESAWVLKSPSHLPHLDALLAVLPEALIVQCHRDPEEAVPSYASLVASLRGAYSDSVDPVEIGTRALRRCREWSQRAIDVRAGAPDRFVDVSYRALLREPLEVIAAIYERLERELTAENEQRMNAWLAAHPQHRHGVHRYDLARFGLTSDGVRRELGDYLERFAGPLVG